MENKGVYGISKKGQQTMIYKGFEYWKQRVNLKGFTTWRCSKHRALKCNAVLLSDGLNIVEERNSEHSHEGNIETALARQAVGAMKKRMETAMAGPSGIQATIKATLPQRVLMALPKQKTLDRALRRHRQKLLESSDNGVTLLPCPVDISFEIPESFAPFVLRDSGAGPDRILMMGCRELLDGLAQSSTWIADGTFKVVPALFFQLFSIHFQFVTGMNPVGVYCLLPNKARATYTRMLKELKVLIPAANPTKILTDFETSAIRAFEDEYPNATVTGCYFHLSQSVIRKVNEIGLKSEYETNDEVRLAVRSLVALAHVPVGDVVDAFEILVESMPAVEGMDELVTYFEHLYVRGRRLRGHGNNYGPALFPIPLWNQQDAAADGLARTTNIVEGWHYGLQSLFQCRHPTMWKFLSGLIDDCVNNKTIFLQGFTVGEQLTVRKYQMFREKVIRAVATYGQTDILTYLQGIVHLSYT